MAILLFVLAAVGDSAKIGRGRSQFGEGIDFDAAQMAEDDAAPWLREDEALDAPEEGAEEDEDDPDEA